MIFDDSFFIPDNEMVGICYLLGKTCSSFVHFVALLWVPLVFFSFYLVIILKMIMYGTL